MIEIQDSPVVSSAPRRRRRWITPVVIGAVAVAGLGVGVALGGGDDGPAPAVAANSQLADIAQACTTWMRADGRAVPDSAGWCQDMTGWMSEQMANGSMMGSMMWGEPDQMLATCRSWMGANPSLGRPDGWCEDMMTGMRPYMNGNGTWEQWDGRMMGG
jgi:hypothetical protein